MNNLTVENAETKVCNQCGRTLPVEKFRLVKGQHYNPYHLGKCKECEHQYQREYLEKKNKITFADDIEIWIQRRYKKLKHERILDISGLNIIPLGTDEVFVKLMDCKNTWLSNYGRMIRHSCGAYHLLQGSYDKYGVLHYTVRKNVFYDRYKPDNWSRKAMEPTVCGIGYHGNEYVGCKVEPYLRWRDMVNRCYNAKFHERQPQYKGCTVCEEWLNYSNFKVWYDQGRNV